MKFKIVKLLKGKQIDPYTSEIKNQGDTIVTSEGHAQYMLELGEGEIMGDHPGPGKVKPEDKPVIKPEVKEQPSGKA